MRTGLLRPRLHSTQTVSTLLSPTHDWALLWQKDLTVDLSHVWESGISRVGCSAPTRRVTPAGAKALDGMSKSLPCWPRPRHLHTLLSSPQGARQVTTIHGCHGCHDNSCHGCHGQTLIWCYIGMVHVLEGLPSHVPSDSLYSAVLGDIIILLQCLTYSVLHILDF